jgi:type II secretion system protein G
MIRIKNFKKGFTLIELLIVIAIIGVLATLLMANFIGVRQRARDAQRKSDIRQIQAALEIYRSDNGGYPPAPLTCGAALTLGGSTYMKKIPCDPSNVPPYVYTYVPSGTTGYFLYSCLENISDSQKDSANNPTYCAGGTTNWSFTVANP